MLMFIPVPIKAKYMMVGLVLIDLFGGVASFKGDNIAHFAHLGGALTGFILVYIWNKRDRRRFY
jgi:membrane associated rhomboid family serine protease